MKSPLVSVCVPVYNAAPYLKECIDSILGQTYADFELLIVDDGSTDESALIAQRYADGRIRFMQNRHDYIGSLNRLLDEARGAYIARMDADDVMMPYRLERQVRYMEAHPDADIVGGAMVYTDHEGRERVIAYSEQPVTAGHLLSGPVMAHPTVMMRAQSVAALRYDRRSVYAEDYQFWCQALKAGLKMVSMPDVLIRYRFTGTNVCCTHASEQREAALRAKADLEGWVTADEAGYATPAGALQPDTDKKLTAIITFLNEGIELERTVADIRRTVADGVDIIVINDCSFDGYPYGEHLAPYHVHYVVNRHRLGVAASRDLGVRLCRTPYFLLLDAHMRFYQSDWADRIVEELQADDRQLLCCQGRFLYKDEATGLVDEGKDKPVTFGAFSPFQKNAVWPDITWNYREHRPGRRTESIPTVLGAAYAVSKRYWQRLRGLEGLHNYGADEQYISLKVWLEGGRCTLLKDVVVGHIYRKKAPYLILGRDSVYNLLLIARLLFPQSLHAQTVSTAMALYRDLAREALRDLDANREAIGELKTYLHGIFTRTLGSLLPMHQACREYNPETIRRLDTLLSDVARHLQEHQPADDGLMEGKTGALLWLCHYAAWRGSEDESVLTETVAALYEVIEKHVCEQRLPWNFRYGVSGIGWGMLYLYAKGLLDDRPDELTDVIDGQLSAVSPESMTDGGVETGAGGVLAYLTLRLAAGRPERPALPLEKWYEKARALRDTDSRREVIYYAQLFCSVYENGPEPAAPLIGSWLRAPEHIPQNLSGCRYTLADGLLGTTLQALLHMQITRTNPYPDED